MDSLVSKKYPFRRWTWKTTGWATICFLLLSMITGLFSFIFDVLLFNNKMGYYYSYFAIIFYTLVLYLFYEKFGNNWFGLFGFGLSGIIGIPIEYILEWQTYHTLKSPWFAVAWGGIYILYGLVADLLYWGFKLQSNQIITIIGSAMLFSVLFILISYLPLKTFYISVESPDYIKDFLQFWYFMIPYSMVQGAIGAYTGTKIAQSFSNSKNKESRDLNSEGEPTNE